jgi:group I intron endonuclease
MFHYVYITTNLINKKRYVGDHSTNNLNDSYLGSGRLFSKKVKQYGKENFNREILEQFETKQEAFDAQEKYIKIYKTHVSEGGYNKDWTGGWNVMNECSEQTRQRQSQTRKGKETWMKGKTHTEKSKEKIREARKLQIPWNKDTTGMYLQKKTSKGQKYSQETRDKMSLSHTGVKRKPHSEETKKKMSESAKHRNCFFPYN